MNIDPSTNASHLYAQNNVARKGPPPPPSGSEKASFEDKLDLSSASKLRNEPEIRPEVVAKGKELLNDPNFPSPEAINHIAKLIQPFADNE